jgi:predicted lipid-binding transport protein (Tim44 family)
MRAACKTSFWRHLHSRSNLEIQLMQRILLSLFAVFFAFALPVYEAEAKRMGGGKSFGMQRQATPMKRDASPQQAQNAPAGQNAAAGAAPKRNWMGPLAGLAAGLGIAALLSHFGLGEGMANILMMALLAFAAFMLVRWFLNRNKPAMQRPMQYAGQGADQNTPQPMRFEAPASGSVVPGSIYDKSAQNDATAPETKAAATFPPGFDEVAFARQAKVNFIRMQAANDAGDVNDLRQFTTPELFAELRLDLQERGAAAQHTDVLEIAAEVVDFADEPERQVVSVRYTGRLQEAAGAEPVAVDEVWHLVKPHDDSRNWAIAGIQQTA